MSRLYQVRRNVLLHEEKVQAMARAEAAEFELLSVESTVERLRNDISAAQLENRALQLGIEDAIKAKQKAEWDREALNARLTREIEDMRKVVATKVG